MDSPTEYAELLQQVAETTPWPVLIVDSQYRILYASQASQKLLGHPIDPSGPALLQDFFSPGSTPRLLQFLDASFSSNGFGEVVDSIRCRLKTGAKRTRYAKVTGHPFQSNGQPRLVVFLQDFSRSFRTRRALREQDQRLHSILDNMGAVIYIKDLEGRYQFINHLFEELFHIERKQIRGKTDYDIFPKANADKFREIDQEVCQSGEMKRLQEKVPQDDGMHTYISVKFPLRDLKGRVTGMAGISTDITDHLHRENEIHAAEAVQQLLYPKSSPKYPGYDIAGHICPAEGVSGDYYDYIPLSSGRLLIAVGDVSGHGLGPALEMVETRAYLRAILRTEVRLDVTMQCLNEFLYRDLRDSAFVTLFLAELDLKNHTFQYVGAGHRADFLRASGERILLKSGGMLLGIEETARYTLSESIPFSPNDLLLIPTDGIPETMLEEGTLFGYEGMLDFVVKNRTLPTQETLAKLMEYCHGRLNRKQQADDRTAVLVKRTS